MSETEQTYLSLVWATKPCKIGPYHKRHYGEGGCDSTGLVLLLPDLSEECHQTHYKYLASTYGKNEAVGIAPVTCKEFGCPGRVPKPIDGFLLLGAMRKAGFRWVGTESTWFFFVGIGEPCAVEMLGVNDLAACTEAAWKAVQARHPQEEKV